MNKRPCLTNLDFQSYLDNQLEAEECRKLEAHVRDCAYCARELEHMRSFFNELRAALALEASDLATSAQISQVMERLAQAPSPHWCRECLSRCKGKSNLQITTPNAIPSYSWKAWLESISSYFGLRQFAAATTFAIILLALGFIFRPSKPINQQAIKHRSSSVLPVTLFTYTLSAPLSQFLHEIGSTSMALPIQGVLRTGSVYRLPPMGKLFVTYKGNNRLELSQQATFELVDKGLYLRSGDLTCRLQKTGHDLIIFTPTGSITPLGTTFFVEVRSQCTRVSLEDGRVILRSPTTTILMERPGTLFMHPGGHITTQFEPSGVAIRLPEGHSPKVRTLEGNHPSSPLSSVPDSPNSANSLSEGF